MDEVSKGLWDRTLQICISTMQGDAKKSKAERILSMIKDVTREENVFNVMMINKFSSETIEKEYGDDIRRSFQLAGADSAYSIKFTYDESTKPEIVKLQVPKSQPSLLKSTQPQKQEEQTVFISTMPLKEYYTFEEFVEGPSNSYVLAAAKGAAKDPGQKGYNPLFIHGGTGLGKTHLMQAIGNEIKRRDSSMAVCYLTAEAFLNEYVNAMTNNELKAFRARYRNIDVLLIDDIQFIAKNMQNFQEEFFNTFNALTSIDKQIVITSDVAPKDLPGIEERLISRFEGGMLQEIESPQYETRLAILKKKSEGMVPPVSENTLKFIAQQIKSHVRAMEGALGKVNIFANRDPSMILNDETLSYILKDFIEKEKSRKKLTIEEVQNCVCRKYGITLAQMMSTERTQSLVTPRQLAMYISRKFTTKSLLEMGQKFDKSHATIIHGAKNIEKRLDVEPDLKSSLEEIVSELGCSMNDMNG